MVQLLEDFPDYVAAYRATAVVNEEEYRSVVMARADQVAANYGAVNFLVQIEAGLEKYSSAALLNYFKLGFKHFSKWNRMAIVADQEWVRSFYNALSLLMPGEIRVYPLSDFKLAKEWVSAPLITDEKIGGYSAAVQAGVAGTTMMTAFSYIIGVISKQKFGEPYLLGSFLARAGDKERNSLRWLGWPLHYGVGIAWSLVYKVAIQLMKRKEGVKDTLPLGVVSGVVAIAFWRQLFTRHSQPPKVNQKAFYAQLFVAHFVFALVTAAILSKDRLSRLK